MMETDRKEPYISQQAEVENLYSHLQEQTLNEMQRLSGKVWTDHNVHNPGVTLSDIANYALTEMDYKLGFVPTDYLAEENKAFDPERFGLFPPEAVYTTAPVTTEDYRRLFFAHIPELENVWVECNVATGGYTVKVVLPPFEEAGNDVVRQVEKVYNSHRNLCEYLDRVLIVQPDKLEFHAEFEIEPGEDANHLLATIYWVTLHYLAGAVRISTPEEQAVSDISPEEWLEGQENAARVVIPEQQNTEYELYKELCRVKGIQSFSTCYLMKDGEPLTDFSQGFSLKIPRNESDFTVRIRCGRSEIKIVPDKFIKRLKALCYTKRRLRTEKTEMEAYTWGNMEGTYRDIFTHYPIANDFPVCYNLSPDKAKPTSFEAYLTLYDQTIGRGLQEAKELKQLLSIEPKEVVYPSGRDISALKGRYLDFLDRLYGVESHPVGMREENSYGETEEEALLRRMGLLQHIARLTKNRAKARDITTPNGENNAPTVKEWFCRLLAINGDEEHTVGNVLPGHSLRLIEKKPDKPFLDRLDTLLIDERMLRKENVIPVTYEELAKDEKGKHEEYSRLRVELPIFNENRISGDLFRNGSCLENYKIVEAAKNEYMLVFHNREKSGWTNLGRTDSKERLNTLANIMRRYLRELNRECETIYVLEPVLVRKTAPFELLIVLPMWTLRFHSSRFREMCRELLRSILPSHLTGRIYWLDERSMQGFEQGYRQLMRALADGELTNYCEQLFDVLYELLCKAVETQMLDDND